MEGNFQSMHKDAVSDLKEDVAFQVQNVSERKNQLEYQAKDSPDQGSHKRSNSLKDLDITNQENSVPVQNRRRRADRYSNESDLNYDGADALKSKQAPDFVEKKTAAIQSENNPTLSGKNIEPSTEQRRNSGSYGAQKISSLRADVARTESNQNVQNEDLFSMILGYFKEKRSLIIIVAVAFLFALIFGFSLFSLIIGGISGIAIVYYMKKHNILLKSYTDHKSIESNTSIQKKTTKNGGASVLPSDPGIADKEIRILSTQIGMFAALGYIIYSYTLTTQEIFKRLKEALSYVEIQGKRYQCHFDRNSNTGGTILFDEINSSHSYAFISNKQHHCEAIVIYCSPVRNKESNEEWEMYVNALAVFDAEYLDTLCIDDCTIEKIRVNPRGKPLENSGFSFESNEIGTIYKTAEIVMQDQNNFNEYVEHHDSQFDPKLITSYQVCGQCTVDDVNRSSIYQNYLRWVEQVGENTFDLMHSFLAMSMPDAIERFANLHQNTINRELLLAMLCACFNTPQIQRKFSGYYLKYGRDDTKITEMAREELYNWIISYNDSIPNCPKDACANVICAFAEYSAVNSDFGNFSDELKKTIANDIISLLYSVLYYEKCGANLQKKSEDDTDLSHIWEYMATLCGMKNNIANFIVSNRNTDEVRETSNGSKAINVDLYARIGAQFYGQYDGDVDVRFTSMLIQFKLPVAEKIRKNHPDFSQTYEYLSYNNANGNLSGDFDKLFETPDLLTDIDFSILLASLGAFLERNNSDRSNAYNCITCVEKALASGREIEGLPSIALLTVALWFSDYKGYKEKVYNNIQSLLADNWYIDNKVIDLVEVRRNIEAGRNKQ